MWMELNEMKLNGREELPNPTTLIENCALLHFTVAASMAHMKVKWLDKGKGIEKWCKILVITKEKMSLSRDAAYK